MKRRRSPRPDYRTECLDCGWNDPAATSTDSARRHARETGHTAACEVSRDYIYRGTDA